MKQYMWLIVILTLIQVVSAERYSDYEFYVKDKVIGGDLILYDFTEELNILNGFVDNDMIKKNSVVFSGDFAYGVYKGFTDETYVLNNPILKGTTMFDDNSNVKYILEDFKLDSTNVDQYGVTEAWGEGMLVYEATIKIKRRVPVDATFSFYQDEENNNVFSQEIELRGEDVRLVLRDDGERQTFRHNRKCMIGCD